MKMKHSLILLACTVLVSAASQLQAQTVPDIRLVKFAGGFQRPVYLTGTADGRLFVVEQRGVIRVVRPFSNANHPLFLDISGHVVSGGETGMLGLAFHPDFQGNRKFYVNYTARVDGELWTLVSEFTANRSGTTAAAATERVLLAFPQPFSNHNGGQLAFGTDGYLYIGTGDGGDANDPFDNAQNLGSLLGKILRINVNATSSGKQYAVPADNPFVNTNGALPEIFAYGFRNPWRFSFDYSNGRLFVADVGQDNREEIDLVAKGGNYGWRVMEGDLCNPAINGSCNTAPYAPPLVAYPHSLGQSVIGGHVYRGTRYPALQGAYLYGDFSSGRVWGFFPNGQSAVGHRELLQTGFPITSFGQSYKGDLFILNLSGSVHLILPPSRFAGRR